jgi:pimeloyl-ACP methyl ester carboxylesterase
MGVNESIDLANVVEYLKHKFDIGKVNLWGRSMGAVTAVLYSSKYPNNVRKMVLDSPFCDFRQLVKEIVNSHTGLPEFLFGVILTKIE